MLAKTETFIIDDLLDNTRFIGWLETMPPKQEYDYEDPQGCPIAQYLIAHGLVKIKGSWGVRPDDIRISNDYFRNTYIALPHHWNVIARGFASSGMSQDERWTFGACLQRARKFLK